MQIEVNRLWKTLDLDHHISSGRTTVDPFDGRGRQWLRRNTRSRSCDESAGIESHRIVVTHRLDIVPEECDLFDHHVALFVFRPDGLLAAIGRVRNQYCQCVDTRLECRHIDGWSREL